MTAFQHYETLINNHQDFETTYLKNATEDFANKKQYIVIVYFLLTQQIIENL